MQGLNMYLALGLGFSPSSLHVKYSCTPEDVAQQQTNNSVHDPPHTQMYPKTSVTIKPAAQLCVCQVPMLGSQ